MKTNLCVTEFIMNGKNKNHPRWGQTESQWRFTINGTYVIHLLQMFEEPLKVRIYIPKEFIMNQENEN
jgi:hypothetical protein